MSTASWLAGEQIGRSIKGESNLLAESDLRQTYIFGIGYASSVRKDLLLQFLCRHLQFSMRCATAYLLTTVRGWLS